jgi:nitroreductase
MDVREALYTTRAMRRVRPDPIPREIQARILDAAIRAPSGGNAQNWRGYADRLASARSSPQDPDSASMLRVQSSAQHLADHFEQVPLFLLAFTRSDASGGSIFPAVWSAQLAARAEGVGSALTTVLGTFHGAEAMQILAVPPDRGWVMACCVSFGYPAGRWAVAARRPAHEVAYRNRWGSDLGLHIPEPLWPPQASA